MPDGKTKAVMADRRILQVPRGKGKSGHRQHSGGTAVFCKMCPRGGHTTFIISYLFFIICISRIPCISAICILFPIEGKNDTPPARGLYFAGKDKTQCHTSLKFKT